VAGDDGFALAGGGAVDALGHQRHLRRAALLVDLGPDAVHGRVVRRGQPGEVGEVASEAEVAVGGRR
jgi:hypothetical protein